VPCCLYFDVRTRYVLYLRWSVCVVSLPAGLSRTVPSPMNNKASVSQPLDELLVGFDLVQSVTTGSVVTASARTKLPLKLAASSRCRRHFWRRILARDTTPDFLLSRECDQLWSIVVPREGHPRRPSPSTEFVLAFPSSLSISDITTGGTKDH
jgi:hypothetical protein